MSENAVGVSEHFELCERKDAKAEMDRVLGDIAEQINAEISLTDRQDNSLPFVDEKNCIEMRSFYTKVGGPYSKTEDSKTRELKLQDLQLVQQLEEDFAQVDDFPDTQERLQQWHEDKELKDEQLAESAVAIVLHKALGSEYLVMKSSPYDDYVNGIDTIVFNKYTGEVVCVFDEMLGSDVVSAVERYDQKIEHVTESALKVDGVNIKYGLTLDVVAEQYIRTAVHDIPLLCLNVNRDNLHQLLQEYQNTVDNKTDAEITMLKKIIDDIQEQKEKILKKSTKSQMHSDIAEIDKLIEKLQTHI